MDKACGLGVFFLLAVVRACIHSPGISITSLTLEGLSGSCLLIPCNFRVKEGVNFPGRKSAAVWIRTKSQFESPNSEFVVFNASATSSKYPMEIIGNVNKKNCTTVFNNLRPEYTEKYFFRAEEEGFAATASCEPIDVTVRDSPWSPSLDVSGNQTESEVVTITCSAVTPCPHACPELTLNLQQDFPPSLVKSPDGTFKTTITSELTLTSSHDGYRLTCSAVYPVTGTLASKTAETTITLNVTLSPGSESGTVTTWLPALCAIVLIALIVGIVYIWWVKFRWPKVQPAQVQIIKETIQLDQAQTEELHYGDISFNQRTSNPVSSCAQEETVYSQVRVSDNKSRKATEMTDIYAQVKK